MSWMDFLKINTKSTTELSGSAETGKTYNLEEDGWNDNPFASRIDNSKEDNPAKAEENASQDYKTSIKGLFGRMPSKDLKLLLNSDMSDAELIKLSQKSKKEIQAEIKKLKEKNSQKDDKSVKSNDGEENNSSAKGVKDHDSTMELAETLVENADQKAADGEKEPKVKNFKEPSVKNLDIPNEEEMAAVPIQPAASNTSSSPSSGQSINLAAGLGNWPDVNSMSQEQRTAELSQNKSMQANLSQQISQAQGLTGDGAANAAGVPSALQAADAAVADVESKTTQAADNKDAGETKLTEANTKVSNTEKAKTLKEDQIKQIKQQIQQLSQTIQTMDQAVKAMNQAGKAMTSMGKSLVSCGEGMIKAGQALLSNPETHAQGVRMIEKGEKLVEKGKDLIAKGEDLIAKSEQLEAKLNTVKETLSKTQAGLDTANADLSALQKELMSADDALKLADTEFTQLKQTLKTMENTYNAVQAAKDGDIRGFISAAQNVKETIEKRNAALEKANNGQKVTGSEAKGSADSATFTASAPGAAAAANNVNLNNPLLNSGETGEAGNPAAAVNPNGSSKSKSSGNSENPGGSNSEGGNSSGNTPASSPNTTNVTPSANTAQSNTNNTPTASNNTPANNNTAASNTGGNTNGANNDTSNKTDKENKNNQTIESLKSVQQGVKAAGSIINALGSLGINFGEAGKALNAVNELTNAGIALSGGTTDEMLEEKAKKYCQDHKMPTTTKNIQWVIDNVPDIKNYKT